MSPRLDRFKLLLDEMFPSRQNFPTLNKLHNLKHIVHEFHGSGYQDKKLVLLAKKEGCILVTKNDKHMQELCQAEKVPLICITETMPYEEIDQKIVSELKSWNNKKSLIKLRHSPRKQLDK